MRTLWFDPGLSTGIVAGHFTDTDHWEPRGIWQVEGGFKGLDEWLAVNVWLIQQTQYVGCEKFIPRPIENGSHTLDSTYPLVLEGLLMARATMPVYPEGNWQPASAQTLVRGKNAEESRKRTDDLVKKKGLWLTGSDVDRADANDALSSLRHTLHFMTQTLRHGPTLTWLYEEED